MPRTRNLQTSLRRRKARQDPMAAFDALPAAARHWLAQAALPWSADSVQREWSRAVRKCGGDEARAAQLLSARESARLKVDAPKTWGAAYPNP